MMWMKVAAAATYAGGLSRKTLYTAIRQGNLKAARIGAGRNFLLCESFVDDWLQEAARSQRPGGGRAIYPNNVTRAR